MENGTRRSPQRERWRLREREEEEEGSENGECFAGDMIILSLSVFKEAVALDPRDSTRKRERSRAGGGGRVGTRDNA